MSAVTAVKLGVSPPGGIVTLLLGFVHLLVPVVGPIALLGYQAELTCRLARREPELPPLRFPDFMANVNRGIVPFVVQLLFGFASFLLLAPVLAVPTLLSVLVRGPMGPAGFTPRDEEAVLIISTVGALGVFFGAALLLLPVFNAVTTRAALTQDLGAALRPDGAFGYARLTYWATIRAFFAYAVLASFVLLVGALLCGVGLYLAAIALQIGLAHLRWQIYERYLSLGGAFIPIKVTPPPAAPVYVHGR